MARRNLELRNIERRRRRRRDGSTFETYRVRWIDEHGRRQGETFDTLEEALAFRDEFEARAARLRGGPAERTRCTVGDAYERWWREHVAPSLQQRTREHYARSWGRHLAPRVGDMLLMDVGTVELERLKDELLAEGVGPSAVRKAIAVLGSLLGHAARRGLVDHNAALAVRKPPARRKRRRRMPPSIDVVERMRRVAIEQHGTPLTATWISIGAYGGLRPGEIRALRWRDIRERTIRVADAVDVDGGLRGDTKTYRDRSADLLPVLAVDLWAWRHITPYTGDEDPVIPTGRGVALTDEDYKNFVGRKFRTVTTSAGWPCSPYDLRHFNASLLIKDGRRSPQEIAAHLGHTLIELSRTYAHELSEYRGRQIDVEAEIRAVRAAAGEADPLERIALELGAEPASRPSLEGIPSRTSAAPPVDVVTQLVALNAAGVLDDSELADKLRRLSGAIATAS